MSFDMVHCEEREACQFLSDINKEAKNHPSPLRQTLRQIFVDMSFDMVDMCFLRDCQT